MLVLLWEPVRALAQTGIDQGEDAGAAWSHAVARVIGEQAQRVAVPRRFTIAVEEIWAMQPRFHQRTKKRAFRLLEHPPRRVGVGFDHDAGAPRGSGAEARTASGIRFPSGSRRSETGS